MQNHAQCLSSWRAGIFCLVLPVLLLFDSSASAAVINLAWDPSADAAGYKIYYGKASRVYEEPIDAKNQTSYSLDLPMGKWYLALTAYDASGNESDFSDEVSWPIQIFSPSPGEVLFSGSSYPITWYGSSSISSFDLYYSTNGGVSWKLIDDYVAGTRSYNWTVPAPVSNKKNCLLKVVGFDASGKKLAADNPDGPFGIEVLKLASPDGDEILTSGDSLSVTWETHTVKRNVASTEVLLTRNGGATWSTIFTREGDDTGGFVWEVPDVKRSKKQCKLKVILKDSYGKRVGSDASDAYFTIKPLK